MEPRRNDQELDRLMSRAAEAGVRLPFTVADLREWASGRRAPDPVAKPVPPTKAAKPMKADAGDTRWTRMSDEELAGLIRRLRDKGVHRLDWEKPEGEKPVSKWVPGTGRKLTDEEEVIMDALGDEESQLRRRIAIILEKLRRGEI